MPGLKEKQFKSPEYKSSEYHEMKQYQEFNKVMNETQKKKPQRPWTNFDQEFEEFLWDSWAITRKKARSGCPKGTSYGMRMAIITLL